MGDIQTSKIEEATSRHLCGTEAPPAYGQSYQLTQSTLLPEGKRVSFNPVDSLSSSTTTVITELVSSPTSERAAALAFNYNHPVVSIFSFFDVPVSMIDIFMTV